MTDEQKFFFDLRGRPDVFVLCDEVTAKEPEPVELNFTCLGSLSRCGDSQFQSTTATNRLFIHSQSTDELDWSTRTFHDVPVGYACPPSHRLTL
jgi:hypothetical protein